METNRTTVWLACGHYESAPVGASEYYCPRCRAWRPVIHDETSTFTVLVPGDRFTIATQPGTFEVIHTDHRTGAVECREIETGRLAYFAWWDRSVMTVVETDLPPRHDGDDPALVAELRHELAIEHHVSAAHRHNVLDCPVCEARTFCTLLSGASWRDDPPYRRPTVATLLVGRGWR